MFGWHGAGEWHWKSDGRLHRLTNASGGLWRRSCGAASGARVGDGCRSRIPSAVKKLAQGAMACCRRTCWAVAYALTTVQADAPERVVSAAPFGGAG